MTADEGRERQFVGVRERERIPSREIISVYVSHVQIVEFSVAAALRGIAMGALLVGDSGGTSDGVGGAGRGAGRCWNTSMMMDVSSMNDLRLGSCLTTSVVLPIKRPISMKTCSSSPVAIAVGSVVVSSCMAFVKEFGIVGEESERRHKDTSQRKQPL